jgi:FkbM family methyltransferase
MSDAWSISFPPSCCKKEFKLELQSNELEREYLGHPFIIDQVTEPIIWDICNLDEYAISPFDAQNAPRTIVDVGAHVGVFTLLCLRRFPSCQVIAIEPHPRNFELLQHNLRVAGLLDDPRLKLINGAVGPHAGTCAPKEGRVQLLGFDASSGQIPVITAGQLLDECEAFFGDRQVGLIKCDCEGGEYYLFPELRRLGRMPDIGFVRGEYHSRPRNFLLQSALQSTHQYHFYGEHPVLGGMIAHRQTPPLPPLVPVADPPIERLADPMREYCVLSMYAGEGRDLAEFTLPPLQLYADQHRFDLQLVKPLEKSPSFATFQLAKITAIRQALELYHRVLWIDGDILVRGDAPNLFELVPPDRYGAVDELGLWRRFGTGGLEQIELRKRSVCEACYEEGQSPPEQINSYFNCGMQVISRRHAPIFAPAIEPREETWCEQNRINARLITNRTPLCLLSEAFNQMWWCRDHATATKTAYFLHYAGLGKIEQKIAAIRGDLREWEDESYLPL